MGPRAGRTIKARRAKAEMEQQLETASRTASELRMRLREMGQA